MRLLLLASTSVLLLAAGRAQATAISDGIVWGFAGTGVSSSGGAVHTVSGQITFYIYTYNPVVVDAAIDGVDALTGYENYGSVSDGAPGSPDSLVYPNLAFGPAYGEVIAPSILLTGDPVYVGGGMLHMTLIDKDGTAWSGLRPNPYDPFLPPLPPEHAPDASLFETRTIEIYQHFCTEPRSDTSCSQGSGVPDDRLMYTITIDSFSDPVVAPEPRVMALSLLALAALHAARRASARGTRSC